MRMVGEVEVYGKTVGCAVIRRSGGLLDDRRWEVGKGVDLDASDDLCPLGFQLGSIARMRLLLAVFQAAALVVF